MKTTAHYSMRRTLAGLAAGLVLGVMFAATAHADMYRIGLNYPPGTIAPYNAGGGIPIQAYLGPQTVTPTNVTLTWYGLLGNYGVEASANLGSWHTVAHGLVTDYAWSQTVLKPDLTNSYSFRVAQTNWFVGQSACISCHDKYIPWSSTHHASALDRLYQRRHDAEP
jgi:hypothetical protein